MNEKRLAGFEMAAFERVVPDGEEGLRNRGGLRH